MVMSGVRGFINLALIFLVVFISHFSSKNITSFDSKWSIYTAMSILKEGNTDLDEYEEAKNDHRVEKVDDHFYNLYPLGPSIFAIPFVYLIDKSLALLLPIFPDLEVYIRSRSHGPLKALNVITLYPGIELLTASSIIAVATIFIYLIAKQFLNEKKSLWITFLFAFCSSVWSTASRGLWQHGPSMFLLTVALYLVILSKKRSAFIQFTSIPLAFSYVVRPTNSVPFLLLTIFVFFQYRHYFLRYLFWAMTIAVPFFLYNLSIYHSVLPPYYLPQRHEMGFHSGFLEALAGNLISPARGLFLFSPIFLYSIYGVALKINEKQFGSLDFSLLGIIFLHWVVISFSSMWWAGWSFGPRLFSDMIPFLIYFLIPVMREMPKWRGIKKMILISIFLCSMFISFSIHFRGANHWEVYNWNNDPVNVDTQPDRVWDWRDAQFLRGKK